MPYIGAMATTTFRALTGAGTPALGTFICDFMTPGIATICGRAGADWVLFDLEHSGYGLDAARPCLQVAGAEELAAFVRVPGTQQHLVATALDAGAQGIMVPYVNSARQAEQLVGWMKYPPLGTRGSAFGMSHDRYAPGLPGQKQAAANADTVFLPQIETPEAVAAAADIAAVDGVDVLFVGPLDLSTNLGFPGDFAAEPVVAALETVAGAARAAGKAAGIFAATDQLADLAVDLGYTVISHSADVAVFGRALASGMDRIRARA